MAERILLIEDDPRLAEMVSEYLGEAGVCGFVAPARPAGPRRRARGAPRAVRVDGEARSLTAYQFALLLALAENAGRVLSRDSLMDLVKGEPLEAFDRSIDVHVSRIRAAIEDDPKKPRRIVTVRGAGYLFAKSQD